MENINKVEYSRHLWYGIVPNKNNKLNNLIEAWNTFIAFFHYDRIDGYWTKANFIEDDIIETQKLIVELANKPEDNITIGILSYLDTIKPSPEYKRVYKNAMVSFYNDSHGLFETSPLDSFRDIKKLVGCVSMQDEFRKQCKEQGIMPMNIYFGLR